MIGPRPRGTWTKSTAANTGTRYDGLTAGARYVVVRAFTDFDGSIHSYGETWIFLGYAFAPHDDGLSLFVSIDGVEEWHIRMQCSPECQGPIVDRLGEYVHAV